MTKQWGLALFLTGWTLILSVIASYWMSSHLAAFAAQPISTTSLFSLPHRLNLHHFLSESCDCSKGVLKYLEQRGSQKEFSEVVHLITGPDSPWRARLIARGFAVEILGEEQAVDLFEVQNVPQLLILKSGKVLYQGGYNGDQSHRSDYHDLEIAAHLESSKTNENKQIMASYPLFGCANGHMRKNKVDPWKLKYAN